MTIDAKWRAETTNFINSVELFNSSLKSSKLTPDDFNAIDARVKKAAAAIPEIEKQLQERCKNLPKEMQSHKTNATRLFVLAGFILVAQTVSSIYYYFYDSDDKEARVGGFISTEIVSLLTFIVAAFSLKIGLNASEKATLEDLIKQSYSYVTTFNNFMDTFKMIMFQAQVQSAHQAGIQTLIWHEGTPKDPTDQKDTAPPKEVELEAPSTCSKADPEACAALYEQLPPKLKDPHVHGLIVSAMIASLKEDDPLRQQLIQLAESAKIESTPATNGAVTNYLETPKSDPSSPIDWTSEKQGLGTPTNPISYAQKWNEVTNLIAERFKLKDAVTFIKTPQQVLSKDGITLHEKAKTN